MFYLDFTFRDGSGRLILAGWAETEGTRTRPDLRIDGAPVTAEVLPRFARADLGQRPLGLLAVAEAPAGAEISVGERILSRDEIAAGGLRLVAESLDETLTALLRGLASDHIGPLPEDMVSAIVARISIAPVPLPMETPGFALAVDRAGLAPCGLGFAEGWALTSDAAPQPVAGLIIDGATVTPLGLLPNRVERPDLAGYRDRYRFSGRDGFLAAFRLPPSVSGQATLVLMPASAEHGSPLALLPLEAAPDLETVAILSESLQALSQGEARATLRQVLSLFRPAKPHPDLPPEAPTGAGSLLLLLPDTPAADLRDVLRAVLDGLPRPVTVQPLAVELPPEAILALAAAATEAGPGVTIAAGKTHTAVLAELARDAATDAGIEVLFGTASALVQMGLPAPVPDQAAVLMHDPLAAIDPVGPPPDAEELGVTPFTLRLPLALLIAGLAAAPRGLLTAQGTMGALLPVLAGAGRLAVTRGGPTVLWPGSEEAAIATRLDITLRRMAM